MIATMHNKQGGGKNKSTLKAWLNHYEIDRCLLKMRYKYYEITL